MSDRGYGETRPTDGKIKAPTRVGRMWLVGLGFLGISATSLAGASGLILSDFNVPSAIARRFQPARRDDHPRRRAADPARPHPARQRRCEAFEELCRRGDACREEG